ncbi:MAG: tripartite tricarboxylate transporter TctB family protein [Ruminococcus sp.]|jgi:hypothetical protein|nr:tripartite tricarboxylate transporter TctB family protein [Ruminococcus sp.]
MKIKYNSNLISGALFLVVGITMRLLVPSQIKTYETSDINAATIPMLLLNMLILLSIILLIQGICDKAKKEVILSKKLLNKETLAKLKPLIYMLMLLAYGMILPYAGFTISSLLLSNGILLYFGARKWWFYVIVSANIFIAYYVFSNLLNVALP